MNPDEAIIINVPSDYPEQLYQPISDLHRPDFKIKINPFDMGMMAGIEWMMPTAIVAYLLKPFFESFLSEAGKDTYKLATTKLNDFIKKNREVKTKAIAASMSTKKLIQNYNQSRTISLRAFIHSNLKVTILFDEDIPDEEMDSLLEGMFQLINYLYIEGQKLNPETEVNTRTGTDLFMIANRDIKQWELLTKQQMSERYNTDKKIN